MLKKVVATILIVTCSVLCLPVFSSAAIYDVTCSVMGRTLIYTDSSSVGEGGNLPYGEIQSYYGEPLYFDEQILSLIRNDPEVTCSTLSSFFINFEFPSNDFIANQKYNVSITFDSGVYGNYISSGLLNPLGTSIFTLFSTSLFLPDISYERVPSWSDFKELSGVFSDSPEDDYFYNGPFDTSLFTYRTVSFDVYIPAEFSSNVFQIAILWRSVNPQFLKISDIKITPLGYTQYLFEESQFRDDVLEGILNIENFLTGEGETFEPAISNKAEIEEALSNEAALNKDFSDELSSNLSGSTNIFDTNGAFSWITNTFNKLFIDDLSLGFVNPFNTLILFSLAVGLCVLILGRRLNA